MAQPDRPAQWIADFITRLKQSVQLELSAIETADVLWLALEIAKVEPEPHTDTSVTAPRPRSSTPPADPTDRETDIISEAADESQAIAQDASVPLVTENPERSKDLKDEVGSDESEPPLSIQVPAASPLPQSLALGRSLRPLMRRIPSYSRQVLDEEATVAQVAEEQIWNPVMKPALERWLDLAIVVEETTIIEVWQDAIAEFQHLMERHGAFRDVQAWQLVNTPDQKLRLFRRKSRVVDRAQPRSPKELLDPTGRRLIVLVSDCTSAGWRSGQVPHLLKQWMLKSPVTILQLLPGRLWDRSALGVGYFVWLRTSQPGMLNDRLKVEDLPQHIDRKTLPSLTLPIVTMEPKPLLAWAKVIAGFGNWTTAGVVLNLEALLSTPSEAARSQQELTAPVLEPQKSADEDIQRADQLVQRFRGTASPIAQDLAETMAAVPVNWSVIRLIQKNLLPEADTVHIAEVFLSGLLRVVDSSAKAGLAISASTPHCYDFVPEVRSRLLRAVPAGEMQLVMDEVADDLLSRLPIEIQERISADIERRFSTSLRSFEAFLVPDLLADFPTDLSQAEALPFARVVRSVLRQLGGEYAEWVEQLEQPELVEAFTRSRKSLDVGSVTFLDLQKSRSLRASETGVQRAKQALMQRNLTQRSLVEEGIAAWATTNRFFNGKPINRTIFLEICRRLDLSWEEIVGISKIDDSEPNPPPSSLLTTVQKCSQATRTALTPRILEPIPRRIVHEKYLPAIARGVEANHQRVIPIIGPAGYGKSMILGDLYDELQQRETAWVGLVLCSLLAIEASPSPQSLAISLGQAVSGEPQSIIALARQLTEQHGRGVLLIDTLNLIISRTFVSAFNHLLRSLLEVGVTVVFTCRDHEYNDFLEPNRVKLISIAESVDRHTVPGFTPDEICQAAISFFTRSKPTSSEQGQAFADNILKLSADNRSLREITQNPLLLALLCDLFAKDGNVPADLTVSKLYKRYWYEKITYSRRDDSHSSLLAIHKEDLCLAIARFLFERSQEKLIESAYRDELQITFSEPTAEAFDDLLSEGVLERLPSQKIHFFHQTLLEYAIAYWLTRHAAQSQRQQWLSLLQEANAARVYTYWYPVLRQHLTIVETDEEFGQLVAQLGTDNVAIFSAIAFAAASRDRPDALLNLLPVALELGESYQRRLRQALESAPRQLAEDVWSAMVVLLEQGSQATAVNTARTLNTLADRCWEVLGSRLAEAIAAVARRADADQCNYPKGDQRIILGWLLQDCLEHLRSHPDPHLFTVLQNYYHLLGSRTGTKVIQLYESTHRSTEEQTQFLQVMLNQSVPDDTELEAAILKFLVKLLSQGAILGTNGIWQSWLDALHHPHPDGWDVLQAKAVGCCAVENPTLISLLVQDLLRPDHPDPRRNTIALSETIRQGAADPVATSLLQIPIATLSPACFNTLASFLRMHGAAFSAADQEAIAQQLQNFAESQAERLLPVFDTLADASSTAHLLFTQLVEQLPTAKQREYQGRLLQFVPIDQHPPIATLDKRSQLFLVKLYRGQIGASPYALQQLLAAMNSKYKEVAIATSKDLDSWLGGQCAMVDLIGLVRSHFPGVRVNALKAITARLQQGQSLSADELTEICITLAQEDNQAIVCLLCQIVADWVQRYRQVPPAVPEAIGGAIARLAKKRTLDGGSTRLLLAALKAIAQSSATGNNLSEAQALSIQQFKGWIVCLLTEIDLIRVVNSELEVIELLCAAHRLDETLIPQLATQECQLFAQRRWLRNISAVIKALQLVEGQHSTIFDQILASDWCSPEVESILLEVKGI